MDDMPIESDYKPGGIDPTKYNTLHRRIARNWGKAERCELEECIGRSSSFEWALKDGCEYDFKRENFIQLCKSCHVKYDMTEETRRRMGFASVRRLSRPVIGKNSSGGVMYVFKSAKEASLAFGRKQGAVSNSINNEQKCAKLKWMYLWNNQ